MAAAAEERVEEEEGDCNYVGGEIAVFVEKLCGAISAEQEQEQEQEGVEEAWRDRGGLLLFCSITAKWFQ